MDNKMSDVKLEILNKIKSMTEEEVTQTLEFIEFLKGLTESKKEIVLDYIEKLKKGSQEASAK